MRSPVTLVAVALALQAAPALAQDRDYLAAVGTCDALLDPHTGADLYGSTPAGAPRELGVVINPFSGTSHAVAVLADPPDPDHALADPPDPDKKLADPPDPDKGLVDPPDPDHATLFARVASDHTDLVALFGVGDPTGLVGDPTGLNADPTVGDPTGLLGNPLVGDPTGLMPLAVVAHSRAEIDARFWASATTVAPVIVRTDASGSEMTVNLVNPPQPDLELTIVVDPASIGALSFVDAYGRPLVLSYAR